MAKGQCLGQGFQPTFGGHCSWGAGGQEGAPCSDCLMHVCPWASLCASACPAPRTGGVPRRAGTALLHTRVHARSLGVRCVCSLRACARSKHAQLLGARSSHVHHTHSLHTHCRLHACPVPTLRVHSYACSEHARLLALCTLFHTHRARSACALCKHCTHPLCSRSLRAHHMLHACSMQILCARSLHVLHARSARTLCTLCTLGAHTQCWHAHKGRAGSVDALHTPHILCARSGQSQLHPPRAFSPWAPHVLLHALCILSLHAACTLAAHPRACPMHPSCTLRVPSCTLRACFPCAVLECPLCTLHAHPLAHSLRALIACSLCTHVCFLHAPCTLIPARKPLKRCPRKMRDGRGKLWVRSIGN